MTDNRDTRKSRPNFINPEDPINQQDLKELTIETQKAIELKSDMIKKQEEILTLLRDNKRDNNIIMENQSKAVEKINSTDKKLEELDKTIYKLQVLLVSGGLVILGQIISILVNVFKH